jgi:HEPN domain-containing protein
VPVYWASGAGKTLKALFVKEFSSVPPRTHDLIRLADKVKIEFGEETIEFLDGVNTFHIAARYPDEKMKFYRMCTPEFTEEQFGRIKEIYQCLLEKIRQ